jgi:hypothetical protein
MKKSIFLIFLTDLFLITIMAYAAEEMKSHDMQMSNSGQTGKLIRDANVEGYRFSYHLIDMQDQMKNMEGMQHNMQQMSTHHLMLNIQDAEGKTIDSAQVGYLIIGSDGSEQKVMTMGMSGAYGADINLSKPGEYTIKCKAVVGEKKLLDEFKYKIE